MHWVKTVTTGISLLSHGVRSLFQSLQRGQRIKGIIKACCYLATWENITGCSYHIVLGRKCFMFSHLLYDHPLPLCRGWLGAYFLPVCHCMMLDVAWPLLFSVVITRMFCSHYMCHFICTAYFCHFLFFIALITRYFRKKTWHSAYLRQGLDPLGCC